MITYCELEKLLGEYISEPLKEIKTSLDAVLPKPKAQESEAVQILEKAKKLVPDQYDIIIDVLKFAVERIENPEKIKEDKEKVETFFTNVKQTFSELKQKIHNK